MNYYIFNFYYYGIFVFYSWVSSCIRRFYYDHMCVCLSLFPRTNEVIIKKRSFFLFNFKCLSLVLNNDVTSILFCFYNQVKVPLFFRGVVFLSCLRMVLFLVSVIS